MLLFDHAQNRDNNFKLIAFVAALSVLFSHSWPLSEGHGGKQSMALYTGMTTGTIAVDVFFIISGFFIARSLASRKSIWSYFRSRILRIYPPMIVSTLFAAYVVGLSFTTLDWREFVFHEDVLHFIKRNSLLYGNVKYHLPGVFLHNPYPDAVVGSVWTLPYQIRAYIYMALIVLLFDRLGGGIERTLPRRLFCVLAASVVVANVMNHTNPFTDDHGLRLYAMFATGTILFLYRHRLRLAYSIVAACILAMVLALWLDQRLFYAVYSICIGYLLMFLAYVPGGVARRFNGFGDYSFGIYIYGFTVQQSIVAVLKPIGATTLFLLSAPIVVLLAWLSWHSIEKHALKLRRR